jgi:hypothetical protein
MYMYTIQISPIRRGFAPGFVNYNMIYFDSDMSKSTNTVVYFDWKTVIYIYVCGKCRTQFMLPMKKSVTFPGACANEIIPSDNSLVC